MYATVMFEVFETVIIRVAPAARVIVATDFSVMSANMKFEG
jgi:hypothetical protein